MYVKKTELLHAQLIYCLVYNWKPVYITDFLWRSALPLVAGRPSIGKRAPNRSPTLIMFAVVFVDLLDTTTPTQPEKISKNNLSMIQGSKQYLVSALIKKEKVLWGACWVVMIFVGARKRSVAKPTQLIG